MSGSDFWQLVYVAAIHTGCSSDLAAERADRAVADLEARDYD